jgi:hypothetical protein
MRASRVLFSAAAATAVIAATASRPSDAAPGAAGARFVLTSFVQRGRTDVRRNEILEFRFSAPLRRGSVDLRTLQVNELIPEGRRPVVGARIVQGNVVRLDPRRTQGNYDAAQEPNATVIERDHEVGFAASAQFEVQIRNGADKRVLRARDGRRIARRYDGGFATNTLYEDPVPGQPSFGNSGDIALLDFRPPRSGVTGIVDPDASIVFRFSEPIAPESMRLGDTVIVERTDGTAVAGTLAPDPADQNLTSYLFTATGGYGSGVDVRIAITTGVTDLAGNALKRPFSTLAFRTASAQ